MPNDPDFLKFVTDQLEASCEVTVRAMFGGHTLYSKGKVVALVCDDKLFVKPTAAGRAYIGEPTMAPAYPGAKDSFLIEDRLEDGPWLSELIRRTEAELPLPRPKRKRPRSTR